MKHSGSEVFFRIDLEDIYLQEFSIENANSIYKISNQPEISSFLPDWKSTREQRMDWVTNYEIPANKAFLEAVKNTAEIEGHFLKLGVFISATDEFIGWCCTGIKEELPAPNREIMYAISAEYHGNGYATKASVGLINYLFANTNLEILNAVALQDNPASNKVIEKCGFAFQGQRMIDEELFNHYILTRTDWKTKN